MQYMLLKKDEFLRERSEQGFIFSSFRLSGPDPEAGSVIGGPLFLVEHIYSLRLSQRDASLMKSVSNAGLYDYRRTTFRSPFLLHKQTWVQIK